MQFLLQIVPQNCASVNCRFVQIFLMLEQIDEASTVLREDDLS